MKNLRLVLHTETAWIRTIKFQHDDIEYTVSLRWSIAWGYEIPEYHELPEGIKSKKSEQALAEELDLLTTAQLLGVEA